MLRAALAILVANLPVRWWGPFEERLPVYRYAGVSGLVLMLAGFAIGIPGYFAFMEEATDGFNRAIAGNPDLGIQSTGWGLASLPIFLFATPVGLVSIYFGITGMVRAISAHIVDEVHGDFLLTWFDASIRKTWNRVYAAGARRQRLQLEGAELPDRLVSGEQIGRPDLDLVLFTSRRRDGWEPNAYLVGGAGTAHRIGTPFDFTLSGRLRTAYPLTLLRGGEAIRLAIAYELPPLWRAPIQKSE